ncbi:unnamed protein product [Closterium sp. NIES-64]|nr:unnamed protein product [Closterium sp. NIES-64]
MLARCGSLKHLTLKGKGEARESISPSKSPQKPSLECRVAMLVCVEQQGVVGAESREGEDRGGGGTDVSDAAPAAAAETPEETTAEGATPIATQEGMRGKRNRRYYLDICTEAAAACSDSVAAIDESKSVLTTGQWKLRKAAEEALQTLHTHGELALASIRHAVIEVRAAMSLCRCMWLAMVHLDGRVVRDKAMAKVCSTAESAGFFTAALDHEREEAEREREGRGGGGGTEVEELVGFVPESKLPADLAEARALLHALTEQLVTHMEAMGDAFEPALPLLPEAVVPGAVAPRAAAKGAVTEKAAGDGSAAQGAAAEGAASEGATAAKKEAGGMVGEGLRRARTSEQLRGAEAGGGRLSYPFPSASPRMCPSPPITPLPSLHSSSSPYPVPRNPSSEPHSFKSLARAAVFARLKSLALVNSYGVGEGQLVRLLSACGMLEDLRVEGSDGFSDAIIAQSKSELLTRLTVVECGGITAGGIGGLLGNVPRLRYLKVEVSKVSDRARKELLRAGVAVRGV